ncbi:DUF1109 domain-containing protein [Hylemonella gracilis]|uniref:Anti-sigma F factor n=1 Tax=Hylemonella gracilis ATCC 19624 TaxID=887062 RepID=F3KW83_9BURK|nr:DUF1109 domain-containing protein [Hylemonella gracilis]EGI75956.1 hypothetical protein HGR_13604 [Hylemonella gracilis ATCC 19624]
MKTKDMISLLAADVAPVDRHVAAKRFAGALLVGGIGAVLLMLLRFGLRPDLQAMLSVPLFWIKMAVPLALGLGALAAAARLSRPGVPVTALGWAALILPVLLLWSAAVTVLWLTPAPERMDLLLGQSWKECPFNIAMLSVPGFIAVMGAMRGLAPTRPRWAGAMAGLLSGSVATLVYCLHCPEMGVPFWAVWYLLGMLLPALVGALLGPRLLRW